MQSGCRHIGHKCFSDRPLLMDWRLLVGPVAQLLTAWQPSRCQCAIEIGSSLNPNADLIRLLEAQLQRCGPANLTLPAPVENHFRGAFFVLLIFVAGWVAGCLSALCGLLALRAHWLRSWSVKDDDGARDAAAQGGSQLARGNTRARLLRPGPGEALVA